MFLSIKTQKNCMFTNLTQSAFVQITKLHENHCEKLGYFV